MKIEYDHQADALYLQFSTKAERVWKSREVERGVVLDVNKKGSIVGIEILEASHRFKPKELSNVSVKHVGELMPTR